MEILSGTIGFVSGITATIFSDAIAEVRYRFSLVRSRDGLPIVEDAKELYALRKQDGAWIIASNIDHFSVVGEGS